MLTRVRHVIAPIAALLALSSQGIPAQEPERPPPVETHELTIDRQVEIAQSMADHEAVAQLLEDEAAEFERHAVQHDQLCKRYRHSLTMPKATVASIAHHCERIVTNLKASAGDARAMARLHREVTHKLVK